MCVRRSICLIIISLILLFSFIVGSCEKNDENPVVYADPDTTFQNPYPANGSTGFSGIFTFSWDFEYYGNYLYALYLGFSAEELSKHGETWSTEYEIWEALQLDRDYYWQVQATEYGTSNVYKSPVWNFHTAAADEPEDYTIEWTVECANNGFAQNLAQYLNILADGTIAAIAYNYKLTTVSPAGDILYAGDLPLDRGLSDGTMHWGDCVSLRGGNLLVTFPLELEEDGPRNRYSAVLDSYGNVVEEHYSAPRAGARYALQNEHDNEELGDGSFGAVVTMKYDTDFNYKCYVARYDAEGDSLWFRQCKTKEIIPYREGMLAFWNTTYVDTIRYFSLNGDLNWTLVKNLNAYCPYTQVVASGDAAYYIRVNSSEEVACIAEIGEGSLAPELYLLNSTIAGVPTQEIQDFRFLANGNLACRATIDGELSIVELTISGEIVKVIRLQQPTMNLVLFEEYEDGYVLYGTSTFMNLDGTRDSYPEVWRITPVE